MRASKQEEHQFPAIPAKSQTVRAPLLTSVIADFNPEDRVFVIDLGGLRKGTLNRLMDFPCRLDVIDLEFSGVEEDLDQRRTLQTQLGERLPAACGELADLLLCWNQLNYFSRSEIGALMAMLLPRLSAHARIHALIESSSPDMPATPAPVALDEADLIRIWPHSDEGSAANRQPAPRHSTDGLLACLPGMIADQTMLLGNGQKEYLFRWKG